MLVSSILSNSLWIMGWMVAGREINRELDSNIWDGIRIHFIYSFIRSNNVGRVAEASYIRPPAFYPLLRLHDDDDDDDGILFGRRIVLTDGVGLVGLVGWLMAVADGMRGPKLISDLISTCTTEKSNSRISSVRQHPKHNNIPTSRTLRQTQAFLTFLRV